MKNKGGGGGGGRIRCIMGDVQVANERIDICTAGRRVKSKNEQRSYGRQRKPEEILACTGFEH